MIFRATFKRQDNDIVLDGHINAFTEVSIPKDEMTKQLDNITKYVLGNLDIVKQEMNKCDADILELTFMSMYRYTYKEHEMKYEITHSLFAKDNGVELPYSIRTIEKDKHDLMTIEQFIEAIGYSDLADNVKQLIVQCVQNPKVMILGSMAAGKTTAAFVLFAYDIYRCCYDKMYYDILAGDKDVVNVYCSIELKLRLEQLPIVLKPKYGSIKYFNTIEQFSKYDIIVIDSSFDKANRHALYAMTKQKTRLIENQDIFAHNAQAIQILEDRVRNA